MEDLNNEVSGILDAFRKLSDLSHKANEITRLKTQNKDLQSRCGSCELWMTQQCPRESKRHKVSNGEPVCPSFKQTKWSKDLMVKNENKVKEIQATL